MAHDVKVPIRLRVGASELAADGRLDALLGSALDRTLTRSTRALAARGGSDRLSVVANDPMVRWSGAVDGVPSETRAAFEARLRASVEQRLAQVSAPNPGSTGGVRVSDAPPVILTDAGDAGSPDAILLPRGATLLRVANVRDLITAVQVRIARGEIPLSGRWLAVLVEVDGPTTRGRHVVILGLTSRRVLTSFPLINYARLDLKADGTIMPVTTPILFTDRLGLRIIAPGALGGEIAALARAQEGRFRTSVRRTLAARQASFTQAEEDRLVEQAREAARKSYLKQIRLPADAKRCIVLYVNADRCFYGVKEELPLEVKTPIVPLIGFDTRGRAAGDPEDPEGTCPGPDSTGREPFLCEAPLERLNEGLRNRLLGMMTDIALDLAMPVGSYPAAFSLEAMTRIGLAAQATVSASRPSPAPGALPKEIVELQRLAALVPKLTALRKLISDIYAVPDNARLIGGFVHGRGDTFIARFYMELRRRSFEAVPAIFKAGCQALLLRQLTASAEALAERLDARRFADYAELFAELVVGSGHGQPSIVERLMRFERLRAQLVEAMPKGVVETVVGTAVGVRRGIGRRGGEGWAVARRGVIESLASPKIPENPTTATPTVEKRGDTFVIVEGSRTWTLTELDQAIRFHRMLIESTDPVFRQIVSTQDLVARVRGDRKAAATLLREVLEKMQAANADMRRKVAADGDFAYGLSASTRRGMGEVVAGDRAFVFSPAHEQVDALLRPAFAGDPSYEERGEALGHLVGASEGKRAFEQYGLPIVLVVLAVACPPLGLVVMVAGVGLAVDQVLVSREHAALRQAVFDPDSLFTAAEVEMEEFAAEIGLILAVLPFGKLAAGRVLKPFTRPLGEVAGRAGGAVRASVPASVRAAAGRLAARAAQLHAAIESLRDELIPAVALALAENALQDKLMETFMHAAQAEIERDFIGLDPAHAEAAKTLAKEGGAR